MAENTSALDSHDWETRQVEIKPGVQATQQTCRQCSRHFIDEHASDAVYAVHVGMLQFDRLSEEVSERWLAHPCPRRRLDSDLVDLEDRYREGDPPAGATRPGGLSPRNS
jgi:hypothetical protein